MAANEYKQINLPYKEGQNIKQAATEYILDSKTLGAFVIDSNANSVSSQALLLSPQPADQLELGNLG